MTRFHGTHSSVSGALNLWIGVLTVVLKEHKERKDVELITDEVFRPYVGAIFELSRDDGSKLPLLLAEIRMLPPRNGIHHETLMKIGTTRDRKPFALTFVGPSEVILPQRIYPLTLPESGISEEIFLVPVGKDSDGVKYEAVFN